MSKKFKVMLVSITLLLVSSIFLGTSYSLWKTSYTQVGTNEVNIGCFTSLEGAFNAVSKGLFPGSG